MYEFRLHTWCFSAASDSAVGPSSMMCLHNRSVRATSLVMFPMVRLEV